MKQLRLFRDLALPVDVAGEAIAILAKRGAGKTNTATVLVEELHDAGVQVVILDPVGAWWGLRSGADGKSEGLPIARLGGAHADVPLEPTVGELVADVAVDTGEPLLIDLSDFPSKAAVVRFTTAFADRLYRRKGRSSSLLHVVLEEADTFAPQKAHGETGKMQHAVEQIVRRGRGRGIGITMVTQRSAVLSKDVLSQADVLIAMRTTSPHDIRAIREWVDVRGDERGGEVIESLPGLETGDAWVWNPERDVLARTKVRRRRTFDSSATPKAGERSVEPKKQAQIDLDALGEQIRATAERARENDPAALRQRARELERQLASRPAATTIETVTETVEVEVPAVADVHVKVVAEAVDTARAVAATLTAAADQVAAGLARVAQHRHQGGSDGTDRRARAAAPQHRRPAPVDRVDTRRPDRREDGHLREAAAADARGLSSSQQRVLDALAWFEQLGIPSPSRPALAFIAGTRPTSGGFKNNLGALRSRGLLDYPQANRVQLTEAGRLAATPVDVPATDSGLQEEVLARLTGSQAAIVRALIDAWPDALTRDDLAERVAVPPTSGGFKNNLGALRSLELIDYPQAGYVVAEPVLFPETQAAYA